VGVLLNRESCSFKNGLTMSETIINFWENIATASIGIIVTMIGFWVAIGRNMATKTEVSHMIETQSPYIHDRQFIMERLASNKESQAAFANALQRNSDVMNELKVQIGILGKTLEALEDRIERN
jgi:divalent metal cation (Fe/Co/Zn/Cd) transporter